MQFKFVGEIYFEAEDVDQAHAKLGEHFTKLSQGVVSHLTQVGSTCAIGAPEVDEEIKLISVVDRNPT